MRKLKYYIAMSLDGCIADEEGSFDSFIAEGEHVKDYIDSLERFDIVLMGRKTYEVGLKEGKTNPYPMMKSYVFSQTIKESPDENIEIVSENVSQFVNHLKQGTGKDIYLCGGANLATTLFQTNLIDEVIIKLNPFLMGSGIPLFSGKIQQTNLELTQSKIYDNGIVLLFYQVKNDSQIK